MAIGFRVVENAPLPAKKAKPQGRKRQRYDFHTIPVGGAGVCTMPSNEPELDMKKFRARIYSAAYSYAKSHPDFHFQLHLHPEDRAIWVHRIAAAGAGEGDGGAPASQAEGLGGGNASDEGWGGLGDQQPVAAE